SHVPNSLSFPTRRSSDLSVECVAFPRIYDKIKSHLKHDGVVRVSGRIDIPSEKLPCIILDNLTEFVPPEEAKHEDVPTLQEQVRSEEHTLNSSHVSISYA